MNTRRFVLLCLSALSPAVAISVASAADMPIKTPVYKAQPSYAPSWTGFYVGLNAGYGFGSSDVALAPVTPSFNAVFAAGGVPRSMSVNSKGFIGGAQAGYNYQFGTSWLAGVEADFQYSGIKGDKTVDLPWPSTTAIEHKMDWFGTARARVGYLWTNALLLYGTGGFAFGHVKNSASIAFPGPQLYSGTSEKTQTGWTAGAGAEWAMTRNWTVKAEYLYYDLGKDRVLLTRVLGPAGTASADIDAKGHIGRVGLNYRF